MLLFRRDFEAPDVDRHHLVGLGHDTLVQALRQVEQYCFVAPVQHDERLRDGVALENARSTASAASA